MCMSKSLVIVRFLVLFSLFFLSCSTLIFEFLSKRRKGMGEEVGSNVEAQREQKL